MKLLVTLIKPFLNLILKFFFDKKYLNSKYFTVGGIGYKWAFQSIWTKNILRLNKPYPFPTAINCTVSNPDNIFFDPNDLRNFQSNGTYFQNFKANIYLGSGTFIAQNVGFITANHDPNNLQKHSEGKDIIIGNNCWIGMNAIILPGVELADHVIVGAGAVVTKSFLTPYIIIAGNPAKFIKPIEDS